MGTQRYAASDLAEFLRRRKIATMAELKEELGTSVDMTVFRKLRELSYQTSYSHGSGYYTLDEIAQFDEHGLWSCGSVWFSRHATLQETLVSLVSASAVGYSAHDLRQLLHVEVKDALLRLVRKGRLAREKVAGIYVYGSATESRRRAQFSSRRRGEHTQPVPDRPPGTEPSDEVKAAIVLFVSLLDEKQRRLYAGLEALKFGPGGERWVADLLGLHPQTVAKGRRQLVEHDVEVERIRKHGGGRKRVEKKRRR
jgi:hypothetical protein